MDFDTYVRSLGQDPATLTPEASTALEAAWRASLRAPTPAPVPSPAPPTPAPVPTAGNPGKSLGERQLEEAVAKIEADNQRKSEIATLCQKFINEAPDRVKEFQDYAKIAMAGNVTANQAELEFLRRSYKNGPLAFSPSKPAVNDKVLEVAVARAIGMSSTTIEKDYDERTLTSADRQFRGGCGLKRLIVTCARSGGLRDADEGHFTSATGTKRVLTAAFRENAADDFSAMATSGFGPSTYNLSGILSNVMNKSIRDYFNSVEMVWRQITATRPVNDFKQITGYALTGDLTYKEVAPGGEVEHGTLGESSYSNQAKLYALMLGIDYQHIRNDDLGAFQSITKRLGRGGALTINEKFWLAFMTTAGSFWSAANGNYANSTDYEFTLDKLENANLAWQTRVDPDGKPMGDKARFLLTPSKWELKGRRYMRSTTINEDSGDGADNPLAGMWEPISSTYLGNSSFTGYSVDDYYLLKDPADMPVIETVFLDGQEMPTIETAEPDLSRLGIMTRGMHGFGVNRQEKLGGFRFKQTT